jgi:hypothetical protein
MKNLSAKTQSAKQQLANVLNRPVLAAMTGLLKNPQIPEPCPKTGNTNIRGRLSTVDLLIIVACFVTKVNNIFNIKIY